VFMHEGKVAVLCPLSMYTERPKNGTYHLCDTDLPDIERLSPLLACIYFPTRSVKFRRIYIACTSPFPAPI